MFFHIAYALRNISYINYISFTLIYNIAFNIFGANL